MNLPEWGPLSKFESYGRPVFIGKSARGRQMLAAANKGVESASKKAKITLSRTQPNTHNPLNPKHYSLALTQDIIHATTFPSKPAVSHYTDHYQNTVTLLASTPSSQEDAHTAKHMSPAVLLY